MNSIGESGPVRPFCVEAVPINIAADGTAGAAEPEVMMTAIRNTLCSILVALLAAGIGLATTGSAHADEEGDVCYSFDKSDNGDGTSIESFLCEDSGYVVYVLSRGEEILAVVVDTGVDDNPDPESSSSGEKDKTAQLIASLRDIEIPAESFWNTSVGRALGEHGIGPGSVWNPSEDSTSAPGGGGGSVDGALVGIDQLIEEIAGGQGGDGGGFEGNGDGIGQQLKDALRKGGGGSDDDDDDGGSPPPPPGEELPGPADVVNPPTVSR